MKIGSNCDWQGVKVGGGIPLPSTLPPPGMGQGQDLPLTSPEIRGYQENH